MERSAIDSELFRGLLAISYTEPLRFPMEVDRRVTRNRSLSSTLRRAQKSLLFRSLRWRRRLWGDILPSSILLDSLEAKLSEAEALRANPPLARWRTLSLDSLSRELSYPTWLVDACVHAYGLTQTVNLLLALNEEAPTTLRVNTLKTTRENLEHALTQEDVQTERGRHSPWALHLNRRVNLRSLESFKKGWFEIQDEGSQMAIHASGACKNMCVVDACAGAGGKSLALAAMMENQGRILAVDSDSRPLDELRKRAKRAGVSIVEAQWIAQDDPAPLSEWEEKADLVVVDAPCSSLGTLRRHPWLKWHYTPAMLSQFPIKQRSLLHRFSPLVRPGGYLHYVTCTIHPLENQEVIATFVRENRKFKESKPSRLLMPQIEGTDGFFMATLDR